MLPSSCHSLGRLCTALAMSIPTCKGGSLLRVEALDTARFLPILTGWLAMVAKFVDDESAQVTVAYVSQDSEVVRRVRNCAGER